MLIKTTILTSLVALAGVQAAPGCKRPKPPSIQVSQLPVLANPPANTATPNPPMNTDNKPPPATEPPKNDPKAADTPKQDSKPADPPKPTDPIKVEPPKPSEIPKPEPPKQDPPVQPEPPKNDTPKAADPPKVDPPKAAENPVVVPEPPKVEPPKEEPPKVDPPKVEPPKADPPPAEPPKTEPKVDPPKPADPPKADPPPMVQASTKAGVGWAVQERSAEPVAQFFTPGSHVSWWYDWNKNNGGKIFPEGTGENAGGQFVPMLYDNSFLKNGDPLQAGYTDIMGFNEPDLFTATGVSANMDANTAASSWKEIVDTLKGQNPNVKLWSPGMAAGKGWLVDFFNILCPGWNAGSLGQCQYAPKYVQVHSYTTDFGAFQGTVKDYHDTFGLDVVVSEFACYNFGDPKPVTLEQASEFMKQTTKWLEEQPWVYRYAWFGAAKDTKLLYAVAEQNRLIDAAGKLTPLGEQYKRGGQ